MAGMLSLGHADAASQSVSNGVAIPTFGTPAIQRLLYCNLGGGGSPCGSQSGGTNGQFGFIFKLTKHSGTFSLAVTGGATSLEDFDIFFYQSIEATATSPGGELTGSFSGCSGGSLTC